MQELDSETWSRSMVATLGLGMVGASRSGKDQHADGATPAPLLLVSLRRSFVSSNRTLFVTIRTCKWLPGCQAEYGSQRRQGTAEGRPGDGATSASEAPREYFSGRE